MKMMIKFDEVTGENTVRHKPYWPRIPDHPYTTLIVGGSGSGETDALLMDTLKAYQQKLFC